jgi:hypothetical protein
MATPVGRRIGHRRGHENNKKHGETMTKASQPTLLGNRQPKTADPSSEPSSIQYVLLRRYCQLTGDTAQAVYDRRRRGQWIDGLHCRVVGARRLWINLPAAQEWVRTGGQAA